MISRDDALRQVRKLSGLDRFPVDDEAVSVLIEMLMQARDVECSKRALQSFVDEGRECPKPSDLRRAINGENERYDERNREFLSKTKCQDCGGTQWIHGTFLVTKHSDDGGRAWTTKQLLTTDVQIKAVRSALKPNQQILDASEKCHCHADYEPGRIPNAPQLQGGAGRRKDLA